MTDDNSPVTRTECRLRHEIVEQRFGGLERDMAEVKRDMAEVRADVGEMKSTLTSLALASATMGSNIGLLLKILVAVLILVLAGRGLDLSAVVGGL